MAPGDGPPLSLRPYPVADKKPKNIAEFIARINAQPGGFRGLNEGKLRERIQAENERANNDGAEDEDVEMSEGDEGSDDEASSKDPQTARMEVLKNIDIASNTAMLTLDSLSLLLSKQNPTQASMTLSQQLRDMVGIGTIGADRLDDTNITPEKTKDQEDIATGLTLMEINKTRDAAEEANAFLNREMAAEGRYWKEIMAVQKSGWSISKVPQERHTLGVRFGFSEASLEFRSIGLAPMRRGDDGSVQLDIGRLGGVSERLVITYEKDGQIVGRSALPAQTNDDAPLEARVLEARNTIFSQELWHELRREARSLAGLDVRTLGSKLTCDLDPTSKITVEFVTLDDKPSVPDANLPDNHIAETIALSLHILLSYAHRSNELTRTRPMPPHIPRSRGQSTQLLLRPIIARMMHIRNTHSCTQYVGFLVQTLQKAGLPASFTLQTSQFTFNANVTRGPNQLSATQTLIRNMLQPPEFVIKLILLPGITLSIRGRTLLFPTSTDYAISLPALSPLKTICAPYHKGYPDVKALADYLRTATARVLTEHILGELKNSVKKKEWVSSVRGTSIRDLQREDFELRFAVENDSQPVLIMSSTAIVDGKPDAKKWTWSSSGESEPSSLAEVLGRVVGQAVGIS